MIGILTKNSEMAEQLEDLSDRKLWIRRRYVSSLSWACGGGVAVILTCLYLEMIGYVFMRSAVRLNNKALITVQSAVSTQQFRTPGCDCECHEI